MRQIAGASVARRVDVGAGFGSGLEPGRVDGLAGDLVDAVGAFVEPAQRGLDLGELDLERSRGSTRSFSRSNVSLARLGLMLVVGAGLTDLLASRRASSPYADPRPSTAAARVPRRAGSEPPLRRSVCRSCRSWREATHAAGPTMRPGPPGGRGESAVLVEAGAQHRRVLRPAARASARSRAAVSGSSSTRCPSSGPSDASAAASNDACSGSVDSSSTAVAGTPCTRPESSYTLAQRRDDRLEQRARRRAARRFDELDDLGARVRVVGEPPLDAKPRDADDREREPAVGELGRRHDVRDGADAEAHVAATDLAPALDEHDTELLIAREHVARHRAVPRLEHVQRAAPRAGTARFPAGTSAAVLVGIAHRQLRRARSARASSRRRVGGVVGDDPGERHRARRPRP